MSSTQVHMTAQDLHLLLDQTGLSEKVRLLAGAQPVMARQDKTSPHSFKRLWSGPASGEATRMPKSCQGSCEARWVWRNWKCTLPGVYELPNNTQ